MSGPIAASGAAAVPGFVRRYFKSLEAFLIFFVLEHPACAGEGAGSGRHWALGDAVAACAAALAAGLALSLLRCRAARACARCTLLGLSAAEAGGVRRIRHEAPMEPGALAAADAARRAAARARAEASCAGRLSLALAAAARSPAARLRAARRALTTTSAGARAAAAAGSAAAKAQAAAVARERAARAGEWLAGLDAADGGARRWGAALDAARFALQLGSISGLALLYPVSVLRVVDTLLCVPGRGSAAQYRALLAAGGADGRALAEAGLPLAPAPAPYAPPRSADPWALAQAPLDPQAEALLRFRTLASDPYIVCGEAGAAARAPAAAAAAALYLAGFPALTLAAGCALRRRAARAAAARAPAPAPAEELGAKAPEGAGAGAALVLNPLMALGSARTPRLEAEAVVVNPLMAFGSARSPRLEAAPEEEPLAPAWDAPPALAPRSLPSVAFIPRAFLSAKLTPRSLPGAALTPRSPDAALTPRSPGAALTPRSPGAPLTPRSPPAMTSEGAADGAGDCAGALAAGEDAGDSILFLEGITSFLGCLDPPPPPPEPPRSPAPGEGEESWSALTTPRGGGGGGGGGLSCPPPAEVPPELPPSAWYLRQVDMLLQLALGTLGNAALWYSPWAEEAGAYPSGGLSFPPAAVLAKLALLLCVLAASLSLNLHAWASAPPGEATKHRRMSMVLAAASHLTLGVMAALLAVLEARRARDAAPTPEAGKAFARALAAPDDNLEIALAQVASCAFWLSLAFLLLIALNFFLRIYARVAAGAREEERETEAFHRRGGGLGRIFVAPSTRAPSPASRAAGASAAASPREAPSASARMRGRGDFADSDATAFFAAKSKRVVFNPQVAGAQTS